MQTSKNDKVEVLSSLSLQMAIHYHISFAPIWAIAHLASLIIKGPYLPITYKVILIALHFITTLIEPIRLYLGYYGNLSEQIPALSGFWITSFILQLPITLFLSFNAQNLPVPLELCSYFIHGLLLLVEIISGFTVIRKISNSQMAKFKRRLHEESEAVKNS